VSEEDFWRCCDFPVRTGKTKNSLREQGRLNMTSRKQGDLYEIDVAHRLEGKVVAGSGSTPTAKEDIRLPQWLLQAKSTINASHGMKLSDLRKLRENAIRASRLPLYVVGFLEYGQVAEEWVAMPMEVFRLLNLEGGIEIDE
jgi:hypothetical protein